MKNLDMKMINVEQLNVVAGGGMDENEGFFYQEGTVTDMGGRTAFVKIAFLQPWSANYTAMAKK